MAPKRKAQSKAWEPKSSNKRRRNWFAGGPTDSEMNAAYDSAMAARAAAQATAAARQVSRSLEKKGVDVPISQAGILATYTTNGQIVLVNGLIPGTAMQQRDGRKVMLKSVRIKTIVQNQSTGTGATDNMNSNVVRVALIWDSQPGGVMPTWAQIFGDLDNAGATANDFYSDREFTGMKRFQILRDKYIVLNPGSRGVVAAGVAETDALYDDFVKIGRETLYNAGVAGTIADIQSGALYFGYRAREDSANTVCNINGNIRLRYVDG